jgi:hypothetical protein
MAGPVPAIPIRKYTAFNIFGITGTRPVIPKEDADLLTRTGA